MTISFQSFILFLLPVVIAGAQPHLLTPQIPAETADHRKYCEGLRNALANRSNHAAYHHALTNLQSCPESLATPVLLLQWQHPPEDTVAIKLLANTTKRFRDQRLLEAVLHTAANTSVPRNVRIGTFHTLVAYVDRHAVVIFRQLEKPGLSGSRYVLLGSVDHDNSEPGGVPLRASAGREILKFLADLGAKDPDSTVRATAKFLAEQLGVQQ